VLDSEMRPTAQVMQARERSRIPRPPLLAVRRDPRPFRTRRADAVPPVWCLYVGRCSASIFAHPAGPTSLSTTPAGRARFLPRCNARPDRVEAIHASLWGRACQTKTAFPGVRPSPVDHGDVSVSTRHTRPHDARRRDGLPPFRGAHGSGRTSEELSRHPRFLPPPLRARHRAAQARQSSASL